MRVRRGGPSGGAGVRGLPRSQYFFIFSMSYRSFFLFLGLWVIALTLSGLPASWKTVLLVLTGFFLIGRSFFSLRMRAEGEEGAREREDTFAQSRPDLKERSPAKILRADNREDNA